MPTKIEVQIGDCTVTVRADADVIARHIGAPCPDGDCLVYKARLILKALAKGS